MPDRLCPYCGELVPFFQTVHGYAIYRHYACPEISDQNRFVRWFVWRFGRSCPLDDLKGVYSIDPRALELKLAPILVR